MDFQPRICFTLYFRSHRRSDRRLLCWAEGRSEDPQHFFLPSLIAFGSSLRSVPGASPLSPFKIKHKNPSLRIALSPRNVKLKINEFQAIKKSNNREKMLLYFHLLHRDFSHFEDNCGSITMALRGRTFWRHLFVLRVLTFRRGRFLRG